ncbi:LuxR C-terminal-related transcriptional regulator [Actinomadura scrupuli]|uniref:LuxR C-terminal-related transcriptional regulator n=1 Tax=Actinomadura scrupuli TaxID=559629 RepID=UPI003D99178C
MAGVGRLAGRWPLVARDMELTLFRDALDGDTVRALLVYGPPGVGKTRFAEECLELAAQAGHRVARTAASRAAAAIPLGALAHLLPSGLGGDSDPGSLVDRALQDLRELAGPDRLLLFVDDLPLLDSLSLVLLTQLVGAGAVFLVATLRTGDPVPDVLGALWSGDRALRIDLADLDRPGAEALLQDVLGGQVGVSTLAEFWLAGRGNPLYLRELMLGAAQDGTLRHEADVWRLTGPLPSSPRLLELVGERIRSSGEAGRAVLDRLALCQPLGLDELAEPAGLAVLEELESAGLIQMRVAQRRHEVTLTHPVYAQVLQGSMARIRSRGMLLDQVGRVEANGVRRREDALRVATWRLDATGTADPRLLLRACRLARHAYDHAEMERLARSALEAEDGAEARLLFGEALNARGRFQEAEEVLLGATGLTADDDLRQRLALARAVNLTWGVDRPDLAAEVLDHGRRTLPLRYHGELIALAAMQLAFGDRPAEALALLAQVPPAPGRRPTRMHCVAEAYALAATGRCGRASAVLAAGHRPWDPSHPESQYLHAGSPLMAEAIVDHAAGRLPAAITTMTLALEHGVEDDLPQAIGGYAWRLGELLLAAGRPRTAARWARDGIAVARAQHLPGLLTLASACLAVALAQLGDAEGARTALAETGASPGSAGMIAQAHAWTAAAAGELTAARETLLAAAESAAARQRHTACAELLHDVARMDDPGTVMARLDELALRCDSPLVTARAVYARGAAKRDGALLEDAAERFATMGAMLYAAEAATAAAQAWQWHGDPRRAAAATARASILVAGCEGARTPALSTVERGVTPLTQREREICLLAAQALTSKQIADRLVLSIRTVNNHLQNAYAKLGVGSRGELATALRTG